MVTRNGERSGLAEAARHVAEHAAAIARLEARLALQEMRRKTARLAAGLGLLAAAGLLGLLGLAACAAAGIAALALVVPVWLALLIAGGSLLVLGGLLGLVGRALVRRGAPPIPTQAIEEARLTTEALRNGRH